MTKTIFLAAAAVIAMTATGGIASAATDTFEGGKVHSVLGRDPKASVLYDQSANSAGIPILSQNFGSSDPGLDSQAADDFTVPEGKTWMVTQIEAYGGYIYGGPATSENVYIYKAGKKKTKGLPGTLVMEFDNLVGTDDAGTFTVTLPRKSLRLKAGTYFVSVAANMAAGTGKWGWYTTTAGSQTFGSPADWENPGGAFGVCPTYAVETTCVDYQGQGADHVFTIFGTSK
jgi:hypothetical protein